MDRIDRKIITLLAEDARRSLASIGDEVALSPSSVNERIKRLTSSGVIRRFSIDVDPEKTGAATLVFIWIALRDTADETAFRDHARTHPQIIECHHVTGAWSYLVKARVPDAQHIETLLADLKAHGFLGRSETVLALSSPVPDSCVPKSAP